MVGIARVAIKPRFINSIWNMFTHSLKSPAWSNIVVIYAHNERGKKCKLSIILMAVNSLFQVVIHENYIQPYKRVFVWACTLKFVWDGITYDLGKTIDPPYILRALHCMCVCVRVCTCPVKNTSDSISRDTRSKYTPILISKAGGILARASHSAVSISILKLIRAQLSRNDYKIEKLIGMIEKRKKNKIK